MKIETFSFTYNDSPVVITTTLEGECTSVHYGHAHVTPEQCEQPLQDLIQAYGYYWEQEL